jgi:dihydroflavonol-4-reductase
MRIAVTGATGLLGANLVAELRKAGHEVRATKRERSRTEHLEDLDVEWVLADLGDEDALARAFDGCEQVFHCAADVSIRRRATPRMTATNVAGTQRLLRAVERAGVARLVHTSSTVAVGLSEDGVPVDEEAPWNFARYGLDDGYATTKRESERLVLEAARARQVDAVVVNPGFMFGARDIRPSSGQLLWNVAKGRVPGTTPGKNSFTDVLDVVRGMIAAAERGRTGERYILAGHNLSYAELLTRAAAVAGARRPRLRVPRLATIPVGWAFDLVEALTGKEGDLNSNTLRWSFADNFIFSSAKAERELGYVISPLEPAMARCLEWFRARRML